MYRRIEFYLEHEFIIIDRVISVISPYLYYLLSFNWYNLMCDEVSFNVDLISESCNEPRYIENWIDRFNSSICMLMNSVIYLWIDDKLQ